MIAQPFNGLSELNFLHPAGDLFNRNQFPLARARADCLCPLPGLGGGYIALPEWPGSALPRPDRVNRAACGLVEEYAVVIGLFAQRAASVRHAGVQADYLFQRLAQEFGDRLDLGIEHPDEARVARATVAAASTRKGEAVLIPWVRHHQAPFPLSGEKRHY